MAIRRPIDHSGIWIELERCRDCACHQHCTQHVEEKYNSYEKSLREAVCADYPLEVNPGPLVRCRQTQDSSRLYESMTFDSKKLKWQADGKFGYPRLGAFEVWVCYGQGGRHEVSSKLKMQRWPKIDALAQRIEEVASQLLCGRAPPVVPLMRRSASRLPRPASAASLPKPAAPPPLPAPVPRPQAPSGRASQKLRDTVSAAQRPGSASVAPRPSSASASSQVRQGKASQRLRQEVAQANATAGSELQESSILAADVVSTDAAPPVAVPLAAWQDAKAESPEKGSRSRPMSGTSMSTVASSADLRNASELHSVTSPSTPEACSSFEKPAARHSDAPYYEDDDFEDNYPPPPVVASKGGWMPETGAESPPPAAPAILAGAGRSSAVDEYGSEGFEDDERQPEPESRPIAPAAASGVAAVSAADSASATEPAGVDAVASAASDARLDEYEDEFEESATGEQVQEQRTAAPVETPPAAAPHTSSASRGGPEDCQESDFEDSEDDGPCCSQHAAELAAPGRPSAPKVQEESKGAAVESPPLAQSETAVPERDGADNSAESDFEESADDAADCNQRPPEQAAPARQEDEAARDDLAPCQADERRHVSDAPYAEAPKEDGSDFEEDEQPELQERRGPNSDAVGPAARYSDTGDSPPGAQPGGDDIVAAETTGAPESPTAEEPPPETPGVVKAASITSLPRDVGQAETEADASPSLTAATPAGREQPVQISKATLSDNEADDFEDDSEAVGASNPQSEARALAESTLSEVASAPAETEFREASKAARSHVASDTYEAFEESDVQPHAAPPVAEQQEALQKTAELPPTTSETGSQKADEEEDEEEGRSVDAADVEVDAAPPAEMSGEVAAGQRVASEVSIDHDADNGDAELPAAASPVGKSGDRAEEPEAEEGEEEEEAEERRDDAVASPAPKADEPTSQASAMDSAEDEDDYGNSFENADGDNEEAAEPDDASQTGGDDYKDESFEAASEASQAAGNDHRLSAWRMLDLRPRICAHRRVRRRRLCGVGGEEHTTL
eukprot:TRINITY_DN5675_c0_g1_i2.p1 TRINITY_DN5675_c0_g1~~TRINITY_DN5675_c0_g1_i2.p1  ORF type:complete len:1028 (+),score=278.09 TRINITY_DN5675_c0_g1_i2:46-3129(+)